LQGLSLKTSHEYHVICTEVKAKFRYFVVTVLTTFAPSKRTIPK